MDALQRRQIGAALAILFLMEQEYRLRYPRAFGLYVTRKVNLDLPRRQNVTFATVTKIYTDASFKRAFRMDRKVFEKLLSLVWNDLKKNDDMGRRAKRPTIQPDVTLGVTLRMLAGGSYLDLMAAYEISDSAVYEIFHSTTEALMKRLRLPGLPRTIPGLRRLAEEFKMSRSPPSPLSGCVGALDGIAIKIKKPSSYLDPAYFYCRKGYYAIPVQAVVDSDYRFLCYSARCVGSTHDSLAHAVSSLGQYLEAGNLRNEFWIAGDEAYVCSESLITPVPASQASDWEDAFNFWHSSLRMHVEQSFGMLVAKWRILLNLNFSVEVNTKLICLTMKLHNFCIENAVGSTHKRISRNEMALLVRDEEEWYEDAKDDGQEAFQSVPRPATERVSRKRAMMVEIVKQKTMMRPVPTSTRMPDHGRVVT